MKRWLASLFIALYLSYLSWGAVCHTFKFGTGVHPAMYFVVWDMFCGWTCYELRHHVIAEGISGTYYEVDPAPWGEIHPFGHLGRRHYDVTGGYCGRFALNTLRHTQHEPIARILVIEENWAKKHNLPNSLWNGRFAEPREVTKYYNLKWVFAADGTVLQQRPAWLTTQYAKTLLDNPRVAADSARGQPIYANDLYRPQDLSGSGSLIGPGTFADPRVGAPLAE